MRSWPRALLLIVLVAATVSCGGGDGDGDDSADGSPTTTLPTSPSTTAGTDDAAEEPAGGTGLTVPEGAAMVATVEYEVDGETRSSTVTADDPFTCNCGNVTDTQWVVFFDGEDEDATTTDGDEVAHLELHLVLSEDTTSTSGEGTGGAELELADGTSFFALDAAELSVEGDGGTEADLTFQAESNDGLPFSGQVHCATVE